MTAPPPAPLSRSHKPGPVLTVVLCCSAFALSALVAGFFGFVASLQREERPIEAEAEGVVALTGGSDRVLEAAGLLARGQGRRLLITGVNPATRDADLARILPMSKALFDCCVDLGYRARDTAGNAVETRSWVRAHGIKGPLIVVTSNYHMPRALAELSAALPGMSFYPYSVVSDHVNVAELSDTHVLRLLAREYLKYLRAIVRIRLAAARGG
ncbi:MAG TPA: YdcF family protein [Methylocystis sp.]|nr:YdcF family protein [Methylocystis sp.]